MKLTLPGINIQYPISERILAGDKTVETRTYPIPNAYIDKDLYLIETPGKEGNFVARVVAIIRFGKCFRYESKADFRKDVRKHRVETGSKWDWNTKAKWGWPIQSVKPLAKHKALSGPKGIKFTKSITLEIQF